MRIPYHRNVVLTVGLNREPTVSYLRTMRTYTLEDHQAGAGSVGKKMWTEYTPEEAIQITLPHPEIQGPLNEEGDECPWPWDPPQLKGAPIGQYHCPYCLAMVIAGMDHVDYRDKEA